MMILRVSTAENLNLQTLIAKWFLAKHCAKSLTMAVVNVASLLKKPGEGLLTVTTGSGEAQRVLGPLVGRIDEKEWRAQARSRMRAAGPHIIGFPSDSGGGICRGAAHGPLHLRAALYARHPHWAAGELGDLPCIPQLLEDGMLNREQRQLSGRVLWGRRYKAALPVAPLNLLQGILIQGFKENPDSFRPLVIGGDHSLSGSVFEALFQARQTKNLAVLHFDAHTDLLESRYGVPHCFATWAAHAVKRMDPKSRKNFIQLGLRVSGKSKEHWQSRFGLRQMWAKEILHKDPVKYAKELLADWQKRSCDKVYISFDVDALDPQQLPSTGTPEKGGLSVSWCQKVIETVSKSLPVIAADIVELAPVLGSKSDAQKSSQNSARVAKTLLEALRRGVV
jgi:agmatinase